MYQSLNLNAMLWNELQWIRELGMVHENTQTILNNNNGMVCV